MFHVKPHDGGLGHLALELERLEREGLLRAPRVVAPGAIGFASNDYLGLADTPAPPEAAGAGASRLIAGQRPAHEALESSVAAWLGMPAALVFSSGYAANVGVLTALAGPGDRIVSDALNHASIVDGARLSKAEIVITAHNDADAVAEALARPCAGRTFVVTESYFSMDADVPDLARLRALADAHGAALIVDEAHALGVLGPGGRGLCAEAGVVADVLVGTFGKAFGAAGAFVAGSDVLTRWLWNRARSFVFSTGVSPAVARAALANLLRSQAEPALRQRTVANADRLRAGLATVGVEVGGTAHVIPWLVGDGATALRIAAELGARGFDVVAIRPPTVPRGGARLRLSVTARHTPEAIDALVRAAGEVLACAPR